MSSAACDEPGLVLLFITDQELLENRAPAIGLRVLLDGLSELGIACQVISHLDSALPESIAHEDLMPVIAAQPVGDSPTIGNQPTLSGPGVGPDCLHGAARHQPQTDAAADIQTNELVALVIAALDRQPADLVILTSETFAAPIAAICETRGIPTAVLWDGNGQQHARSLGGVTAVIVSSQALADYLRNGFGLPAVCMPPLLPEPVPMADVAADRVVFDASYSNQGLWIFATIAAEIERHRPHTPLLIIRSDGVFESSTETFAVSGVDTLTRTAPWGHWELWPHARVLVAPMLDWQKAPWSVLAALRHGVPTLICDREPLAQWFGEGALPLPLSSPLTGPAEVATWVTTVLGLYDDPAFAARKQSVATDYAERFSLKRSVAEYAHFFDRLARTHSQSLAPTSVRVSLDLHVSRTERFSADHPWPSRPPAAVPAAAPPVPHRAETDRLLALALSVNARLVVELGAGSGALTQSLAQQAPSVMIVAVDRWPDNRPSPLSSRSDELPATPFDSFLSRCWEQRQHVIPVRRDPLSGLKRVAEAGLQPDLVYVHGKRDIEEIVAELRLARRNFPQAVLLGDDYNQQPMRQAVGGYVKETGLILDCHPTGGWRLLEKWQISAAGQTPPGRNEFVVLVPHLNGIEFECEQSLQQLEAAGVRVVRREGCSAIDVARNELLSEALHDGAEAMMFIDSDIGFDPLDALQLLARPEDVVAAVYAKKNHREMASLFADDIKQVQLGAHAPGLYPLKFAAAGFLRIRAQVLHRMISEIRLPLCNTHWGRGIWPFFQPLIVPHPTAGLHYLGEDWAFSHRLAEIGVTPLADTSIRLWHWGRYGFSWEDAGQDVSRYANYTYNL